MIEFKILSSPDRSQIASYQHLGAELTLGKSEGDMLVDDPQISALQIRVRLMGGQAVLQNADPAVEIRLNGRPVDGEIPIKEKDNISMGKTSIQFTRLDLEPPSPPPPVEYRNAAGRFTPESKEQAMLDALQFLERQSEDQRIASSAPPPPMRGQPPLPPGAPRVKPPLPPGMPPLPKKG